MNFSLQPWQLLLIILAGWVNRRQQQVIDYLRTENQILKEKLGGRRILLDDDQRRRLAAQGKILGRMLPAASAEISSPNLHQISDAALSSARSSLFTIRVVVTTASRRYLHFSAVFCSERSRW